jgi:hypothetical protein
VRSANTPKKAMVAVRNLISTSKPSKVSRIGSFDKVSQLRSANTTKASIARPNFFPIATATSQTWCTGKDSNLRTSLGGTDLQSVGFNHSPTCASSAPSIELRAIHPCSLHGSSLAAGSSFRHAATIVARSLATPLGISPADSRLRYCSALCPLDGSTQHWGSESARKKPSAPTTHLENSLMECRWKSCLPLPCNLLRNLSSYPG